MGRNEGGGILDVAAHTLLWFELQLPADRLLFLAISATSNVGLSHDALSINGVALLALSLAMTLGRIVPVMILWWMVRTVRDEEIAIG